MILLVNFVFYIIFKMEIIFFYCTTKTTEFYKYNIFIYNYVYKTSKNII